MKTVEIFQLNVEEEGKFFGLKFWTEHGLKPSEEKYHSVWRADIDSDLSDIDLCEKLFAELNWDKPEDFHGHSPSTSDVFVVNEIPYFCDSFGFKEITW